MYYMSEYQPTKSPEGGLKESNELVFWLCEIQIQIITIIDININ